MVDPITARRPFTFSPSSKPVRNLAKGFADANNPGTGGFLVSTM